MKKILPLVLIVSFISSAAYAEDYVITIKDQQFSPKEMTIPANEKVKVLVKNLDKTPAEFESSDMNREKVVTPGSEITLYLGPLKPGTYRYLNDFHRDAAGAIIAK